MKIKAIAHINNTILYCTGTIKIHWIKEKQAYISWQIINEDQLLAGKTENIYIDNDSEREIINKTIARIEKYRLGRKKVFSEIVLD